MFVFSIRTLPVARQLVLIRKYKNDILLILPLGFGID